MAASSPRNSKARTPSRLAIGLLAFAILNGLAVNWLLPRLPIQPQLTTTLDYTRSFFDQAAHGDSWKAMRTALFYTDEPRQKPIYTALYFENNVRFQYPPSSLLVLRTLRASLGPDVITDASLNKISWFCIWGVAVVVARIFFLSRRRFKTSTDASQADEVLFAACAFALTLTFYPIVRGYYLGQIQVWIDLLIALVVWCWLEGRRATAGFFLSLICVIKPTLALVVVWGAVRRQWSFIAGFTVPMACFAVVSLVSFGWSNHTDYLGVLSYISQQGEIFHPNQSMNGLLNRLFHNGNSLVWERDVLMTYNPWVHGGTVLSTLALMVLGFWKATPSRQSTEPVIRVSTEVSKEPSTMTPTRGLELSTVIVCATLASPTVWTHHYGVMLPLFAIALPAVLTLDAPARMKALLGLTVCYVLISNNFRVFNRLSETHFNFLQSTVYFAGLGFLASLIWLRSRAVER